MSCALVTGVQTFALPVIRSIFYERPDLMTTLPGQIAPTFQGEKITVFMGFILSEIPPCLRGFVTVGVIAAAAINSGLISMAAVAINDFYRPFVERNGPRNERHFILAGRLATVILGILLFLMSIVCFYWQRYSDIPLLEFVLGVMRSEEHTSELQSLMRTSY